MILKKKIFLDKLFGLPVISFLNAVSQTLLLAKRRIEPDNSNIKRITICKFMGMGSIIQSTPLVMTLRAEFPNAEIVFITLLKNFSLLSTFPFIDKVVTVNDSSVPLLLTSVVKTLLSQWFNRTDILIDLEVHSYFSRILAFLGFPKHKFGFYKKESHIQLGIFSKMMYYNTKAPVHRIYLQAAHLLKCKDNIDELYDWTIITSELNKASASWPLTFSNPGKEYIVINPNSSDLRIERRWDRANYIDLINRLLSDYPEFNIVLTGSPDESSYVSMIYNGIKDEFRSNVIDSSGKLTVQQLISLIYGCRIMITNDSGPMHIAFALKKTTIALFGPCSPEDYKTNQHVYFVYKNLYCSPCVHHFVISPCKGDNQCMKLIRTTEVMKAVNDIMGSKSQWSRSLSNNGILYDSIKDESAFGIVERK